MAMRSCGYASWSPVAVAVFSWSRIEEGGEQCGFWLSPDLSLQYGFGIEGNGFQAGEPVVSQYDVQLASHFVVQTGNHGKNVKRNWLPRIPREFCRIRSRRSEIPALQEEEHGCFQIAGRYRFDARIIKEYNPTCRSSREE